MKGFALACAALAWAYPAAARGADTPRVGTGASERALRLADMPRWNDVFARATAEHDACVGSDCVSSAWRSTLAGLQGRGADEQLAGVQRAINALPYVSDQANWGVADRWETPAEMFARGGDCEGFALTKYFALRELGFGEAALRIAIVWDRIDREQHAILIAETDGTSWVLDNKFEDPVPSSAVASRYRTIWSVNAQGASLSPEAFGSGSGRIGLARSGTRLVIRARPRRSGT